MYLHVIPAVMSRPKSQRGSGGCGRSAPRDPGRLPPGRASQLNLNGLGAVYAGNILLSRQAAEDVLASGPRIATA